MDLVKLFGQYGLPGIALLVIGWLVKRIGERLVTSVDNLAVKFEKKMDEVRDEVREHTETDVEHHNEVKQGLNRLEGRLDGILELTPVREQKAYRARTPRGGVPAGEYGVRRQPTRKDDD